MDSGQIQQHFKIQRYIDRNHKTLTYFLNRIGVVYRYKDEVFMQLHYQSSILNVLQNEKQKNNIKRE